MEGFVTTFGRRAFRRPLATAEIDRYLSLYDRRAELTESGTFAESAQLIIEAFLSSPFFLARVERSTEFVGNRIPLDPYEVASRLSFALWNSMPDDELLDEAERGGLRDESSVRAEAERMLRDPRAAPMVRSFHRRWLGMEGSTAGTWSEISRDPQKFPDFGVDTATALVEETLRFAEHVTLERRGDFSDLLTAPIGFVDRNLAPFYGLDPSQYDDTLSRVELPSDRRAGLLTRIGFLTSHALYDRTSPILRGAFVVRHVLCRELGDPPPDAESAPLPEPDPTLLTTRDRVAQQTSPPQCAGCHETQINPPGFGFETYDAVGAWRDTDNGGPVDASGTFALDGVSVDFRDGVELSAAIAASQEGRLCYTRHWVEFFSEHEAAEVDECVVSTLADRMEDPSYGTADLLADLTQMPGFQYRTGDQ